jgi:hypothetical protein
MGVLVVLVIFLQFIVYGTHQFARSALHIWRTGVVIDISQGLVGEGKFLFILLFIVAVYYFWS